MQQRAALEAVIEGYEEKALRAAVRRAVESGDFDNLKSPKIRAERLTDLLSQWLPKMREKRAELVRQRITPAMEAAWVADARAKRRAEAIIELEEARALVNLPLDDEGREMNISAMVCR